MSRPKPCITKRSWEVTDPLTGRKKRQHRWQVRWKVGTGHGRKGQRAKGGFFTKHEAETYFFRDVLPALELGFEHPDDRADAELKAAEERDRSVKQWVHEFTELHLDHLGKSARQNYLSELRRAVEAWGEDTPLRTVSDRMVKTVINMKTKKGVPSGDTMRGRTMMLRRLFEEALEKNYIDANPCKGMRLPRPGKGRLQFLSVEECQRLLKECQNYKQRDDADTTSSFLTALTATAIYTGARRAELFHLEWSDLLEMYEGKDDWRITIQPKPDFGWTTKNKKPRTVAVHSDLLQYLNDYKRERRQMLDSAYSRLARLQSWQSTPPEKRYLTDRPIELRKYEKPPSVEVLISKAKGLIHSLERQINSTLIFPNQWGGCMTVTPKGLEQAFKKAGLGSAGMHTLRHTYGSHLAMGGVDLPTLQQLMGHSSITTTMIYAHLAPDHVMKAGRNMPSLLNSGRTEEGQNPEATIVELTGSDGDC